jgi:hypothetical protein
MNEPIPPPAVRKAGSMSSDHTESQERDLTRSMYAAAARIRVSIDKYKGPFELRRRQLAAASNTPQSNRSKVMLADTVAGYAADLRGYAAELRPEIAEFSNGCNAFHFLFSSSTEDVDGSTTNGEVEAYISHLKLARAERQVATRAADVFVLPHPPAGAEADVKSVLELFGTYIAALQRLEGMCLSVLAALNIDAPV